MELEQELEALKKTYVSELPGRVKAVRAVIETIVTELGSRGTGNDENWHALEHEVHRIAGSSGTYGFLTLSKLCRYLEDLIVDGKLKQIGAAPTAAFLNRWYATFAGAAQKAAAAQLWVRSASMTGTETSPDETVAEIDRVYQQIAGVKKAA